MTRLEDARAKSLDSASHIAKLVGCGSPDFIHDNGMSWELAKELAILHQRNATYQEARLVRKPKAKRPRKPKSRRGAK